MTNSKLVRMVKYVSIFGQTWFLTRKEAEQKLETEMELYGRWEPNFPEQVQKPRIENV